MEHAAGDTGRGVDRVREMMATGRTGRLQVHVPGRGAASLYLLEGDVISATTPNDPLLLMNCAIARGRLSATAVPSAGEPSLSFRDIEQAIGTERVSRMMAGLFRNNLVYFLFDGGRFQFESMDTVRIPHIQMGHDSSGLLRELEVVHGRIAPLIHSRVEHHVSSGERAPASPQQRHIQALCTSGISLGHLLTVSPFFPAQTLMLIVQMRDQGTLSIAAMEPNDGPAQGAVKHAIEMARADAARRSAVRTSSISAFEDHERAARGDGEGAFTGDRDRVDLNQQVHRRPGLRAKARTMEQTEIVRRVGVCNEVLQAFVETWDDQHGVGDGRRSAQLVVDTAPPDCAALFSGVDLDERGRMGATTLLQNLMRRPEAQRRSLAQRGFADLIDRTLARGAEGLDDLHVDRMLKRVAGYRKRLGW